METSASSDRKQHSTKARRAWHLYKDFSVHKSARPENRRESIILDRAVRRRRGQDEDSDLWLPYQDSRSGEAVVQEIGESFRFGTNWR